MGMYAGANLLAYALQNPESVADRLGLLNSIEALAHYVGNSGTALSMDIADIDLSSATPESFGLVGTATSGRKGCCAPNTYVVNSTRAFTTSGDTWLVLGDITIRLQGMLKLYRSCCWSFTGQLSALPDIYDFNNRPGRSMIGSALVRIGAALPGNPYTINILGTKTISTGGCPR
jgi:hypothetical protein